MKQDTFTGPFTVFIKPIDGKPEYIGTDTMETKAGAMRYGRVMSANYWTEYTRAIDSTGKFVAQYRAGKRWNV